MRERRIITVRVVEIGKIFSAGREIIAYAVRRVPEFQRSEHDVLWGEPPFHRCVVA